MKTYTPNELAEVLHLHRLWLDGDARGSRADLQSANLQSANLRSANLQSANLRSANLQYADLRSANLQSANLRSANLQSADLRSANLRSADLQSANLQSADLQYANLRSADLQYADLRSANLQSANLQSADLQYADLRSANLQSANLQSADLQSANLQSADLDERSIVPESGTFTAYKALRNGIVATLEIPASAGRVGGLTGRKCRAASARVIALSSGDVGYGIHNKDFAYRIGETVTPDAYDPDPRVECAQGIHFFLTRREAEEYSG